MRRGLTLLEVLVTLAILSALTALVLPTIYNRLRPFAFDEAALQVRSALRSAQADAARSGEAVRITASRPDRRSGFSIFAEAFGPDDDPAEAWVDTAAAEAAGDADGGAGAGDPLLQDAGPAFPTPDAALPLEAFGDGAGMLLLSLPSSVRLEQRAGVDADERESGAVVDSETVAEREAPAEAFEPGRSLTLAVILGNGSILVAPGAALVDENGRRIMLGVDPWTGRAVINDEAFAAASDGDVEGEADDAADAGDGFDDDLDFPSGDDDFGGSDLP